MRLKLFLSGALLPPALLLAGCGMGTLTNVSSNMDSPALSGQAYGGQSPISGAQVEVVAMGTSGYGSAGTVLAIAPQLTDSGGNFQFASGAYTCPQSDTPVYLLAIGGNAGSGYNAHIVNAAALGTCTNAKSSRLVVNEVTTVALAFSLAHFFTTSIGGTNPFQADGDWFGGPSSTSGGVTTYSNGLTLGNSYTAAALVTNATGRVATPSSGETIDSAKIYTIANILAACVNTDGSTHNSDPCGKLFNYTDQNNPAPYDTLQAAVVMALNPADQVSNLYNVFASAPTFAFDGALSAAPNDWTIALSYTSRGFALGVDTGTTTTMDIDTSERVWFPTNLAASPGVGYFDQTSRTFNGPYTTPTTVHPEQVAIDQLGYVWASDTESTSVSGYLDSSPSTTKTFSLLNTLTSAVTIGFDDTVTFGTSYGLSYGLADISPARTSYIPRTNVFLPYPVTSVAAGPTALEVGVSTTNYFNTALDDYQITGNHLSSAVINSNTDNSGQVIYTGNDFIATRPFSGTGSHNRADGICIFSQGDCNKIKGGNYAAPFGIAIDGAKSLWLPESTNAGVLQVTPTGNSRGRGSNVYLNSGGGVPNVEYLHDSANGGALITPYGVAIDKEGNVWISNATCTTTFCLTSIPSPNFTLTEIVGAAAPTVVPVSSQIRYSLAGKEPIQ